LSTDAAATSSKFDDESDITDELTQALLADDAAMMSCVQPVAGTENLHMPAFSNSVEEVELVSSQSQAENDQISQMTTSTDQKKDWVDIFSEVNVFQVGCVKPVTPMASGGDPFEKSSPFVPMFPFIYKDLQHGNLIKDRPGLVSLYLTSTP